MFRLMFIVLFLTYYVNSLTGEDPLVETNLGLIKGLKATDGNYSMFLGIPYATVDKDNPFGLSTPQSTFDTIFEAFTESAICPQYDSALKKGIGVIDCLHMNIFVPNSANFENPLPILVWIYGGRFEVGSFQTTRFAPRFLLEHDIIVVTFNYRVGPYGFMCLDTPEVPGNAGLKDQLLALKWIKENIKAFGGDPNKITLSGQSAGGVSVDFHLIYDEENYFNQVIIKSGTAQCPWAIIDSDRNEPIQLAELLGYETNDFREAMDFLLKSDPTLVISAKASLGTVSRPCVEKTFDNIKRFITDYPINLDIPRARTMPIITGYTQDELTFEYLKFPMDFFENPNMFAEEISISFDLGNRTEKMGNYYKHFYVGETMGAESILKMVDFESDFRFNHPTQRSLKEYLENGAEKVYHYLFTYLGGRNIKRITSNTTIGGATHGDEIGYLFDIASLKGVMSLEDQLTVDRMTTMWTNFVKYGDPTPETTELLPIKWAPITKESLKYLEISSELNMNTRPFNERLTFWDFFYDVNRKFQKGYREREQTCYKFDDNKTQCATTKHQFLDKLCEDKMSSFKVIVFFCLISNQYVNGLMRFGSSDMDGPLVETNQGIIRGLKAKDGNYSMFLGIPYATVDENNPFGASIPHPIFEKIFDAFDGSAICPQFSRTTSVVIGTLDCLHINVFVPNSASAQNRLPVYVYIYGGRFQFGNFGINELGPRFLLQHDIILVTMSYRIGPYGFMCLDTPEVPGNAGLKDQLLALRWIKANIESFGGDINKITLGGHSAGAVSVDFHLLYNKEIYFNQIITKSGTAQCPWAIIDADRKEPIQLAELLGFRTDNFREALNFLSKTNSTLVIEAKRRLGTVSRACVEKKFERVERFITDYPYNMAIPRAQTMPILSGYAQDETTFEYLNFPMDFFENPNLFAEDISLSFDLGNRTEKMGKLYKHFYVGETMGAKSKLKIIDFESDLRFNHPTQRSLAEYLKMGGEKVYHYLFTYIGDRNLRRVLSNIKIGGATHGDILGYIFDHEALREVMPPKDKLMLDRIITMWTNFIKNGDPTPEKTELLPIKWEPITKESLKYLEIDSELKMSTRPFTKRLTFWDFFYDVNRKFQKGYRDQN
ncbi:uncharacterized protein [Epargyreus clarus]|uniref:uncharacterized protein n=1 Tax=Epargyreus clarus TaxID=520877 RepID=UPI003C2D5241